MNDIIEKTEQEAGINLSNLFIEGIFKGKLEPSDKKLLNLIAHKVLATGNNENTITVPMSDVVDVGASDKKNVYRDVANMLRRLLDLKFVYDNEKTETFLGFGIGELSYENQIIKVCLSPSMLKVCKTLDKGYTRLLLRNLRPLRSLYSVRLYELLRQYAKLGHRFIDYDTLRELLWCNEKYKHFFSFKARILKPAQREINEKTDITFDFAVKKEFGSKKRKIFFKIELKPEYEKTQEQNLPGELDTIIFETESFELELKKYGFVSKGFSQFISDCGGYDVCKRFWDDLLKADIERQVKRGKLENPGAVIRRGMEQAIKYQSACLEEKTSEKKNTVQDWLKKISALSDVELVELVRSRGDRAVQAYGATAAEIRDNIELMPGVAMCELG